MISRDCKPNNDCIVEYVLYCVFFYTQIILGARTIITEKYKMLVTFDMAIINGV